MPIPNIAMATTMFNQEDLERIFFPHENHLSFTETLAFNCAISKLREESFAKRAYNAIPLKTWYGIPLTPWTQSIIISAFVLGCLGICSKLITLSKLQVLSKLLNSSNREGALASLGITAFVALKYFASPSYNQNYENALRRAEIKYVFKRISESFANTRIPIVTSKSINDLDCVRNGSASIYQRDPTQSNPQLRVALVRPQTLRPEYVYLFTKSPIGLPSISLVVPSNSEYRIGEKVRDFDPGLDLELFRLNYFTIDDPLRREFDAHLKIVEPSSH